MAAPAAHTGRDMLFNGDPTVMTFSSWSQMISTRLKRLGYDTEGGVDLVTVNFHRPKADKLEAVEAIPKVVIEAEIFGAIVSSTSGEANVLATSALHDGRGTLAYKALQDKYGIPLMEELRKAVIEFEYLRWNPEESVTQFRSRYRALTETMFRSAAKDERAGFSYLELFQHTEKIKRLIPASAIGARV